MGNVRTIDFHGDQLLGFDDEAGAFVALKPLVENMGLAWSGQFERLRRDPILSEGIRVIRIPSARGDQDTVCLPVDLIHGFLFRIDAGRVKKPEIREKVLTYQRECYRVLARAFARSPSEVGQETRSTSADSVSMDRALKAVSEARQTHGTGAARQLWFKLGLPVVPAMLTGQDQGDLFGSDEGRRH